MSSSRGKKILALVSPSDDNSQMPIILMDTTANEEGCKTVVNCNMDTDKIQPIIRTRSSSSFSSSSSSSTSTNSSSSNSYKEDSDDSVKDPLYQPENLIKKRRKRKRNENGWKKNIVKKLKNTGKSYESTATKKTVPERKMKEPCNEKCKLHCSTKFSEMDRKKIFDEYWQIGDVEKHWQYLSNCMTVIKPKYRYVREGGSRNKREYNNAFYLTLCGEKVRVCKLFFKNTLGITDRPIRTVMFKRNQVAGTILAGDNRGKHSNHPKIDESIRSAIKAHIESIPKIESHLCRANTSKEYIDGSRSIAAEIHKDYVDICKSQNVPYGNYMLFYKIFTEEYNISFFKRKKGRCDTCAIYENCENDDKENRKEEYDMHLIEKDLCREEKKRKTRKMKTLLLLCMTFKQYSNVLKEIHLYFTT